MYYENNISTMRINAPKQHQYIMQLITGLSNLRTDGKTNLVAYPETMIDESQTSPVPDVLLYDHENEKTKVIIEITHTDGVKKDVRKVVSLMSDYDVNEGFVYNYKQKKWFKFTLNEGEIVQNASFCGAVLYDLNVFLV
jgi:hypothetical protein